MASGMKREVINSRERAVSTDINRLQDFLASEVAQMWFEQAGKYELSHDRDPGAETSPAAAATPPFNAVLGGLRPYPVNGTVDMLVTPGSLFVENATATADDAPFLYATDPGVTAVGVLQLTPVPGATRIDVIECQATPTVLETDNRDIYNIVTGLFAPAAVTKVVASRLTYRIRIGVPGGGFPGLAAGWVPLAVARVPAAAADWDTCDLWDVRNLVSEFWNGSYQSVTTDAEVEEAFLTANETNAAAPYDVQLTGKVRGHFRQFKIGGLCANYPTAAAYVDVSTGTTNWAAGMAVVPSRPWYVYLAFPFDLPGWRKYAGSAVSPRSPYGLRGIPVVDVVAPSPSRKPNVAIALPTALGFGGTTSAAVVIGAGMSSAASRMRGWASDGHLTICKEKLAVVATVSDPIVSDRSQYTLLDSFYMPSTAKGVLIEFELALTRAAPPGAIVPCMVSPRVRMYDPTGAFIVYEHVLGNQYAYITAAGVISTWQFTSELPLKFRDAIGTNLFDIVWNLVTADGVAFTIITADQLQIRGWRM